jgi:hypothetical protein
LNVGEIFLRLGVKSENLDKLTKFKGDAHGAAGTAGDLASAIGKMDMKLKEAGDKIREFLGPLTIIRLQLLATVGTLTLLTEKASKVASELTKFTNLTGLSAQQLQLWQQAAAASGVSAEEVQGSIEGLRQAATDISLGKGNIAPWAMLGIDPRQDPFKVLEQLKDKLKTFPTAMGTKLAGDLGLGKDMINFLKESKSLMPADKSLILSDKEIKKLKEFNILYNRIWDNAKRTLQKFGVIAQPIAEFVLKAFDRMSKALMDGVRVVQWLGDRFKAIAPILGAIAIAIAAYFFPVTAGLMAVAMVLEDIASYARGDDSIIGRLIERYKDFHSVLLDITLALASIADIVTGGKFTEQISNWVTGKEDRYQKEKADKNRPEFSIAPNSPLGQIIQSPLGPQTSATLGQTPLNQTNNVNITVSGTGSPEEVANRLDKKIKEVKDTSARTMFQMPIEVSQ